jgi:hypothetical protein
MFALLTLLACPGGGFNCDSSDSVCESSKGGTGNNNNCNGSPTLTDWGGDCNGGTCIWYVESDQPMGYVIMEMTQTGDPAGSCGAGKGDVNGCGEWFEFHEAFTLAGNGSGACGERKELTLNVVNDYRDQVDNVSTLFDSDTELNQLTVIVEIGDSNDAFADCDVAGDEPGYYAGYCSN